MLHFFRIPGGQSEDKVLQLVKEKVPSIVSCKTESCFNVEVTSKSGSMTEGEREKLLWLFTETFEPENTSDKSYLSIAGGANAHVAIVEVGPRLAFSTAWSSNCSSMCQACGISSVGRIERSRRYLISTAGPSVPLTAEAIAAFAAIVHDRMTECVYPEPLMSFANGAQAVPVTIVPVLTEGKAALERLNAEKGLGFDAWDVEFYTKMFTEQLKRNPTDVECFDMGQSNSEHSRHWFFGGKMIIDGVEKKETLFGLVKSTLSQVRDNAVCYSVV
jgi:phosphoribosylformylglycinamidine synthase